MTNRKICVPVCEKTPERLIEKISEAEQIADIIEIRFDCLRRDELFSGEQITIFDKLSGLKKTKPWIATFRDAGQGGPADLTLEDRKWFWERARFFDYVDLEEDIVESAKILPEVKKIASFHDFESSNVGLDAVYNRLADSGCNIIKIALAANDAHDAIPMFHLLKRAVNERSQIIPIAMGEAGKWTRILGPAHGAFLTFAANDEGGSTAPGQITASEMHDVYRVNDITEQTAVYGIIAGDTSYTASPFLHNSAFHALDIDAVFVPFQVADLAQFMRRMLIADSREIELNLKGFAVTNPHKQAIIPFVDVLDETARVIGAVNTIKIRGGQIYGYNTDAEGFVQPLKNAIGHLEKKNIAILGAGGAARSCIYALNRENANVFLYARDRERGERLASEFNIQFCGSFDDLNDEARDVVVNTTPLGTKGKNESIAVLSSEKLKRVELVYDLVYNPLQTVLMAEAAKAGTATIGGIEMLVAQAAEQFQLWTGHSAPVEIMREAAISRL